MNKQLTPMQELIEAIEKLKINYDTELKTKNRIIKIAKQLLPKEKQVIEQAWYDGTENMNCINASTYYNNKFKND